MYIMKGNQGSKGIWIDGIEGCQNAFRPVLWEFNAFMTTLLTGRCVKEIREWLILKAY